MAIKVKAKTLLFKDLKRVQEGQIFYLEDEKKFSPQAMFLIEGKKSISFKDKKTFLEYVKKNKKKVEAEAPEVEDEVIEVESEASKLPQDQEVI